ncbi:MAG: hypothetical protein OXI76_04850 [Gemmatimonadota bacterium]|nr:hypothetical protein [Gemmatimonadota bacterium]
MSPLQSVVLGGMRDRVLSPPSRTASARPAPRLARAFRRRQRTGQVRDFEQEWTEFLERAHSGFRASASIRDTLRRRVNDLLDCGLIERERARYTVTDDGLSYLGSSAPPPGSLQMIQKLAKEQKAPVRESLRKHLLRIDANDFEELVGRRLDRTVR